jgi:lipopolysaccharide transport system ATP-binding protein
LEVGTGFHPELTGRENIFLNGAILGMSRAEIKKHFDAIVDFAEVEKFLDTPVKRYSSGMYVRLAFAVAAHLEPEILVVDEVLAVGDAEFQKKCLGKMEDVSKNEGRTIIFVSHNMSAVKILCNRGILLKNGRLITDSTVEEATANYLGNTIEQTIEYLNNVKIYKRDLKISDFKINGKNGGEINLDMEKHIRIELIGQSFHSIQGAVDVTISNLNNEAIIFYSPGHIKNELVHLNDKFYLECEVKLPEDFNGGKYIVKVNFSLPNIETYFETKEPISLVVASKIASNGREFTYQNSAYILIS